MDFVQYLRSKNIKERSIKSYVSVISKIISKLGESFTEEQVENYLASLNISPSTYNNYRAIIGFYTEHKLGYKIKFSKAKTNNFLPVELTKEEFKMFLSVIPNIKHKIGFRLMYESGLRVEEVIKLEVYDINFDKLTIRVRGKGNKDRYTIMNETLAQDIREYINGLDKNNPYLMQKEYGGKHITVRTLQERLKTAKIDSKILKKFTCHSLRHSFAINLVNMGFDIELISRLLGHSSIKTTQIYLKCRQINLTEIAKNIG